MTNEQTEIGLTITTDSPEALQRLFGANAAEGSTVEISPECSAVFEYADQRPGAAGTAVIVKVLLAVKAPATVFAGNVAASLTAAWIWKNWFNDGNDCDETSIRFDGTTDELLEKSQLDDFLNNEAFLQDVAKATSERRKSEK